MNVCCSAICEAVLLLHRCARIFYVVCELCRQILNKSLNIFCLLLCMDVLGKARSRDSYSLQLHYLCDQRHGWRM